MSFYPENRFPKKGTPVNNGNGEQYNLSDPRYAYHDDLDNTNKIVASSTNNLYSTPGAAMARAEQIGCGGYHEVIVDGNTMYMPCESPSYYDLRIEQLDSALNFTYIGNYRVLTWDRPFENVTKYKGWIIDSINTNAGSAIIDSNDIAIDFRYSIDGKTWSLWANVGTALNGITNDFSDIFVIDLDPKNKFYPEFRFTSVLRNDDGTIVYHSEEPIDPSIVIVSFDLDLEYGPPTEIPLKKPSPVCSNEVSDRPVVFSDCRFTFNPYAVNKALNVYKDLSLMVNKIFGLDANYYSIQPQARGVDVVLREYTLFNVVSEKCVKLMVNQNQFPDNKINFDPFGLQFEDTFEVQMDKRYFESIFGRGSQPRKRDIIYFPLTNRIYEINSTYLFRDFMYSPVYFKMELKKYNPKSNTYFLDPAYKEELDGISLSAEKLFGDDIREEELKTTKPQQYATTINQLSQDPIRSYIYKDLPIIGYDLNNNWTIVLNNYYDMLGAFLDDSEFISDPGMYRNAIRYKMLPKITESEELSYSAWFCMKDYYNNQQLLKKPHPTFVITLESSDDNYLNFNSYPRKHNLEAWTSYDINPEGYVAIKGDKEHTGGYKVLSIIDEYRFVVENRFPTFSVGPIVWKMQKAQSRNLISGLYVNDLLEIRGFRADIIHSGVTDSDGNLFLGVGSVMIKINDTEINSPFQFTPEYDEWYGIVINFSNVYKQISNNIWKMTYDPLNPNEQSSNLENVHADTRMFKDPMVFDAPSDIETNKTSAFYGTDNNSYKIYTGPIYLSNVRLFKNMIDIDNQSTVLNQNIVRDAQLAHIIDNAKPLLAAPKFARNR
jgi:hypothetical protein